MKSQMAPRTAALSSTTRIHVVPGPDIARETTTGWLLSAILYFAVLAAYSLGQEQTVDKTLEMRCKIEAVFEHYAAKSEYYRRANMAQRLAMEDRFYWLTMELLSKIIGPFEGMEPGKESS